MKKKITEYIPCWTTWILLILKYCICFFNLQQEGTLKAYKNFNVEADADALRKAMKGLGTIVYFQCETFE